MAYVVDASVAIKWLVVEEHADRATALLNSGEQLLAPRWIMTELANVLWKKCRQKLLTSDHASERLLLVPRYFARLLDVPNISAIFDLATRLDHPVYDCIYVQAALDQKVTLITADRRLLRKAGLVSNLEACDLSGKTF